MYVPGLLARRQHSRAGEGWQSWQKMAIMEAPHGVPSKTRRAKLAALEHVDISWAKAAHNTTHHPTHGPRNVQMGCIYCSDLVVQMHYFKKNSFKTGKKSNGKCPRQNVVVKQA